MRHLIRFLFAWIALTLYAQPSCLAQSKETNQELSKAARKGILSNAAISGDGNIRLTYKMKVDKKSDQLTYEDYVFDKDLQFIGTEKTKENKTTQPDQKLTSVKAFVGGTNSFNVLSMSLNLQQEVWEQNWDYDAQKYVWGKRLSKESVKPRNSDSKYKGFAAYDNDDDGSVLVLASYDKGDDDQYVCLHISNDLELTETKLPLNGNYSLVFCGTLRSGNVFSIFAPNKGAIDTRKYSYIEYNPQGKIVVNNDFTAPSPNMLIMDYSEANGNLYFAAASDKSNDAYNQVFTSYAPIGNPGYSTAANKQMDKYEKRVMGEEFDNFHLLQFTNGKLVFSSTTPVKDFKSKVINPPSQKKSHPYSGKKITIQNITVASNGDILIAGQLMDKKIVNKGNSYEYRYYDYVCLHFDNNGILKAQYAVEKQFDDSKDEMFPAVQNFVLSPDGKQVYWELMEAKVIKSYASVIDAYNGNHTYTSHYFPRIATISLSNNSLGDFAGLGEKGKYLVYHSYTSLTDVDGKNRYYIGHDEDYERVWLGKYTFQ